MRSAWAALERVVPRGLLALTSLVVAAATSPESVGIYAWSMLAITLLQSLTDQPVRQVVVNLVSSREGQRFFRLYIWVGGLASSGAMLVVAATISVAVTPAAWALTLIELSPLVAVPAVTALSTRSVAKLQSSGQWSKISSARFLAAFGALVVGIPTSLISRSIVGASLTLLISEAVFWLLVNASAKSTTVSIDHDTETNLVSAFRTMQMYSLLAWLQGQADRLLVGGLAGTTALGSYSLASSVGRSVGDSIAAAQAGVLRVDLTSTTREDTPRAKSLIARHIRHSILLNAVSGVPVLLTTWLLLPRILGPAWASALNIVPVLLLASVPAAISWSSAPVHIFAGKSKRALWAPVAGLVIAPLIAVAAVQSLMLAAWAVLVREIVVAVTQMILMRNLAPWREAAVAAAVTLLGSMAIIYSSK